MPQVVEKETVDRSVADKLQICKELAATDNTDLRQMVAKHEEMILSYYKDVLDQSKKSFHAAEVVARIGFGVLIFTLAYVLIIDVFHLISKVGEPSITVAKIGVVSGVLIEFIAGINFLLYSRTAKQFHAFHICLERIHRYLIAYSICAKIDDSAKRNTASERLACIIANAPMIALGNGSATVNNPMPVSNTATMTSTPIDQQP